MFSLSAVGRIFYGIAMAGLGFQTIYYHDFPYMLIPPRHSWIPGLAIIAYIFGAFLIVSGVCIVLVKKIKPASLVLGTVLLLIFCFYFIPYQLILNKNYLQLIQWDSAEKELALSSGAFIIAGGFTEKNKTALTSLLAKLIPLGPILFCIAIISFGIDHFLYADGVAEYIPSWISNRVVWAYIAGAGLFGFGLAILLRIKPRLFATLLGSMIFIWLIILHIPKVINASSPPEIAGETTSAFLALAYSGIAFVIAGSGKRK